MKRWFIHKNSFSSDSSSIYAPSNLANCSSVNSTMFSTKQPRKIRASLNILPCMDKWELLLWEMSWKMRIMQGHKKKKKQPVECNFQKSQYPKHNYIKEQLTEKLPPRTVFLKMISTYSTKRKLICVSTKYWQHVPYKKLKKTIRIELEMGSVKI